MQGGAIKFRIKTGHRINPLLGWKNDCLFDRFPDVDLTNFRRQTFDRLIEGFAVLNGAKKHDRLEAFLGPKTINLICQEPEPPQRKVHRVVAGETVEAHDAGEHKAHVKADQLSLGAFPDSISSLF